jgi:hypothetical protein
VIWIALGRVIAFVGWDEADSILIESAAALAPRRERR